MKPSNYAPVYAAALYPQLTEIARKHGYAMAVHGSLARDFDVICIPWVPDPSEPRAVITDIVSQFVAKEIGGPPTMKEHGRMAYTLSIGFGECAIDLSFMPVVKKPPASQGERWNIERDGDDLLVCFNQHEKHEGCEYVRYVRADYPSGIEADGDASRGGEHG
jgi:hypothetical protein